MLCSLLWRPPTLSCSYFLPPEWQAPENGCFYASGWKRAILTLLLRYLFSAASRTCLPYLSWGLPLCFVLRSCMCLYACVCTYDCHICLLCELGFRDFVATVFLCWRMQPFVEGPGGIGLYILSFKEVICTLLCQCQEKSVWFGVVRAGGRECRYCFSFSLEEVPQAEPLRDPRRAIQMSSYKYSPSNFLGMFLP